jgi:hypothetical protein
MLKQLIIIAIILLKFYATLCRSGNTIIVDGNSGNQWKSNGRQTNGPIIIKMNRKKGHESSLIYIGGNNGFKDNEKKIPHFIPIPMKIPVFHKTMSESMPKYLTQNNNNNNNNNQYFPRIEDHLMFEKTFYDYNYRPELKQQFWF